MNDIMNLGYFATPMVAPVQQQIPKNCVVCYQTCHFFQIPLDLFVYGTQQVACSENCKNLFQLAKSLTQHQQQLNAYAQFNLYQPSMSSAGLLPTPTYPVVIPTHAVTGRQSSRSNSTDIPKLHVDFKSRKQYQQKKNKTEKQQRKHTPSKPSSPKFQKAETTHPSSPTQRTQQSENRELPVSREPITAVIDTNCLIQRLSDILNLQHQNHVTVIIPQVVVHELDHLKTSKDKRVSSQAQKAIKTVNEIIQSTEGHITKKFRTQLTHEAVADELVGIRNNDDLVIQCARYFNALAPNKTILVTGDAGLSLKAMMHGLQSKKVSDFLSSLPPVFHQLAKPVQRQDNLPYLPANLWTKVFSYLHPRTLPRVSQVCYSFYSTINKDDTIWRANLQRTFKDYNNVLIPQNTSAKEWYIKWREQTLTYRHAPTRSS